MAVSICAKRHEEPEKLTQSDLADTTKGTAWNSTLQWAWPRADMQLGCICLASTFGRWRPLNPAQ
eukprot:1160194-Pelagomonas_calceolata.AAC.6